MTGFLTIDSDGRVHGIPGIAPVTWNTPWPCRNGYTSGFAAKASGVVLHTEDGYEQGTIAWFNNGAAAVSAFFAVGRGGSIHQFGPVGHGWVAWAQAGGNAAWYSIEDADNTHPSVPFTSAQKLSVAYLVEVLSWRDGFPLAEAADPAAQRGVALHSEGGVGWGNHPGCPGPARAAQRPAIIARAKTIRKVRDGVVTLITWTADGTLSLAEVADEYQTAASTILRHTAITDGKYPPLAAAWLNGVFAGIVPATGPVPAGVVLRIPAS